SYVALIADAIASRDLAPATRARLQTDVRAAVKDLNQRYRRVLAARFAVTLGDELQGLLATPQPVWDLAHDVRARLPTVDWVVACGRGPITTPLAPTAPEMDGPCFPEARAAMDRAKPPRPRAALRGGAVRDRGPRPGHLPRPARAAECRWALVGARGTPGHRLPLCLGTGDRPDPERARAADAADAARRRPHRRRDRCRPRPRRGISGARPRPHDGVARRLRRGGLDHRREVP